MNKSVIAKMTLAAAIGCASMFSTASAGVMNPISPTVVLPTLAFLGFVLIRPKLIHA